MNATLAVPWGVPSVFQSVYLPSRRSRKNSVSFTTVRDLMQQWRPAGGPMFATSTVPSGVPSLFQSLVAPPNSVSDG